MRKPRLYHAAKKLIEQIEQHNNDNEHIIVTGKLLQGQTVKKK